ncbi:receptor-transporting protein 3-like [Dendropsophus ebraccatus]|uniref:receptor-transporting protein 3-like n=1 Tax=Dendropsophus ebraccatus TaxID=150705 RepID=UPI0038313620
MEREIWPNQFQNELKNQGISGIWSFYVEEGLKSSDPHFSQHTYASFRCSRCFREWNSAQVHILFVIKWDKIYRRGTVSMRIFRQTCRRCKNSAYETPVISKENIRRVICNLVGKIESMVYGHPTTRKPLQPEVDSNDVDGPHEKEHCEACKMHVCPWNTSRSSQAYPGAGSRAWGQEERIPWVNTSLQYQSTLTAHQEEENIIIIAIIFFIIFLVIAALVFIGNQNH